MISCTVFTLRRRSHPRFVRFMRSVEKARQRRGTGIGRNLASPVPLPVPHGAEAGRASPPAEPRPPPRCPVSQSLNCGTAPRRALILTEEQQADGVGVGVDYLIGGGIGTAERR